MMKMQLERTRRSSRARWRGSIVTGLLVVGLGMTFASAAEWRAGIARAVITPEKAVWLAGYGSKRVPDGKLHDLWMKALALEDHAGQRVVLITSDFQGVPKGMSDRVFARLKKEQGIERTQVMFTFSHNHCGPRLGNDLVDYYPVEAEQVALVEEYTSRMVDRCVAMVAQALARLEPAALGLGQGKAKNQVPFNLLRSLVTAVSHHVTRT